MSLAQSCADRCSVSLPRYTSLAGLDGDTYVRAQWLVKAAAKNGIPIGIVETHRSQARQNCLYACGPTVTKVKTSVHTSRRAFDIAGRDSRGRLTYAVSPRLYRDAHILGSRAGFRPMIAGDPGHFELPASQTLAGYLGIPYVAQTSLGFGIWTDVPGNPFF